MAVMRRVTAACRHVLVFPTPVSDQADLEDATHALTGLSSCSVWSLTNWAADVALVPTGGGLGGCRGAWAAGDVAFTYSDRSISSCGTQEPTSQTREEPVITTVMGWTQQLHAEGKHRMMWRRETRWENMEATCSSTFKTGIQVKKHATQMFPQIFQWPGIKTPIINVK